MSKKLRLTHHVNPFKLFYYRKKAGLSPKELAEKTGISQSKLAELEEGRVREPGKLPRVLDFADLDNPSLLRIEAALDCPSLAAGGDDDLPTQLVHYYETNKPLERSLRVLSPKSLTPQTVSPKAIVFDFEGTLTRSNSDRTTWERLWIELGYEKNECGKLAHRFFNGEIDHEQWCRLTLERFKSKKLSRETVLSIGQSIELIDGFEETIKRIHESGIPMYIISGSIWDVVATAIGEFDAYFTRIEANSFSYNPKGVIANIVGTRYDFEGKGDFIIRIAEELGVSREDILFIGNSINDEKVKQVSGATTMLVNPHLSHPSQNWDFFIPHMDSLTEILAYIRIPNSLRIVIDRKTVVDELVDLLKDREDLYLDNYTVIGGYRRFDQESRIRLRDLTQQIIKAVLAKPVGRENYLISAAPGSGKTYFIEEIGKALGDQILFVQIDLSKDDEQKVRSQLDRIDGGSSVLCLIDEIDGGAGEDWPYDVIYKKLDINEASNRSTTAVFTLIGSSGGDVSELKKAISSRYKSKDLIDRISDQPQYSIEIPRLGLGDGVCVYVSKVLEASARVSASITHVEKIAMFHAAMTAIKSPRQIKMLADQAVARAKSDGSVLKYDHHFVPGAGENKNFWQRYQNAFALLSGDVKIA